MSGSVDWSKPPRGPRPPSVFSLDPDVDLIDYESEWPDGGWGILVKAVVLLCVVAFVVMALYAGWQLR